MFACISLRCKKFRVRPAGPAKCNEMTAFLFCFCYIRRKDWLLQPYSIRRVIIFLQ